MEKLKNIDQTFKAILLEKRIALNERKFNTIASIASMLSIKNKITKDEIFIVRNHSVHRFSIKSAT